MKFSIVSTILLAQGIAAMPWSSIKTKQANGEEITLRIQVGSSSPHGFTKHKASNMNRKAYDICWAACFGEEPSCPEGWYSKNFGDCYTCCRSTGDDL
ncbi:putative pathogenicity protein [Fusarium austroafricanum]|uniref:Putative pathogenicity protein n=1 Tax=Fusarium austroafricanum TaxID=2364996 RepID=A0A8H4JPJ8_9HYPO|nr:putative pathogenicity protein [Fusarium austroafricanum]